MRRRVSEEEMFRIVMKTIMAPILIVLTMMVVITIKKEKCHCQFHENPHLLKMPLFVL